MFLLASLIIQQQATSNTITDTFGRVHTYLRISLTERCNLRCKCQTHFGGFTVYVCNKMYHNRFLFVCVHMYIFCICFDVDVVVTAVAAAVAAAAAIPVCDAIAVCERDSHCVQM